MAEAGHGPATLQGLVARLEQTARELREGGLSPEHAAELVEQCATTAGAAVAELDRIARVAETSGVSDDQLRLGSS